MATRKLTLYFCHNHLNIFTTEMWSCDVGSEAEERFDIEHITKKKSVLYKIKSEVPAKEANDERVRGNVHKYYWWIRCDDNRKVPIITSPSCIMVLL